MVAENIIKFEEKKQFSKPKLEDGFEQMRRELPVFQGREKIVKACRDHATVVLVGETGSGKTTQLPQLLLNDRVFGGRIAVTQPRRVAAISVAGRVALEQRARLGMILLIGLGYHL